jgi:hypothetical protein
MTEMVSGFLCASTGISPAIVDLATVHIDGWQKKLKNDNRLRPTLPVQGKVRRIGCWEIVGFPVNHSRDSHTFFA